MKHSVKCNVFSQDTGPATGAWLIRVKILFADFIVNVVAHLRSRNGSSTSMCVSTPPQTSISTKSCHDLPLISYTALHPCLKPWPGDATSAAQKRRQGTTRLQSWDSVRKSAENNCLSCTSNRIKDCTDASVILGEMSNSFHGEIVGVNLLILQHEFFSPLMVHDSSLCK